MASIDERVVAISFENSRFEANVATTLTTLSKLNKTIAEIGQVNGLASIEASANKVTLQAPMTALDRLKQKLGFTNAGTTFTDMENASNKVDLNAPLSALDKLKQKLGFTNAGTTFTDMENASNKAKFTPPMSALDKLRQKLGGTNAGSTFTDMENASNKATFTPTMSALDKLQQKLGRVSSGTTFTDLEKDSSRVTFSNLTQAIDGIGSHFSSMSVAAGVAMGNVATQVAMKAARIAKSVSLAPIMEGFHNYETQINAVQTILANTGLTGKAGLEQVNGALNNLNKYANLTVYNFSEMAKNIGTFTAAGVKLGPATSAIKGIANLAALSGSNSEQASTAMYQLSQAIAAGKVGLQDWNSVVNAGMGGAVFQKALFRTAEAMGTVKKGAVEIDKATGKATLNGKSFRESITAKPGEKSWLTSDVLTKTLSQFTGDMSNAQLAADGFNKSQIAAIQAQAKTAVNAATQIKTFSQLTQAVKEEVGSAWASVFKVLFGDIHQATTLFSGIHTVVENMLTGPVNRFAKVLEGWAKLGGRTALLDGLKSAFKDLESVLKPIQDAFKEIFPPSTSKQLYDLTIKFRDLMNRLRASPETMDKLRRTFAGVFAVLHIGWTVIKDVIQVFGHLLGAVGKGSGGILSFTGNIGDFLVHLDRAISKGKGLTNFFNGLGKVLEVPLHFISGIAHAIGSLFSGNTSGAADAFSKSMGGVGKVLGPLGGALSGASAAWEGFVRVLKRVKQAVQPFLDDVARVIGNFGNIVADGVKNADYNKIFAAIQTTLIAGIFLAIKKALGGGINIDFGGGVLKSISASFKSLTGNLSQMQSTLKAATLLEIATAIGVLAAGVFILSTINPKRLGSALSAVAVGIGELVAAVIILSKASVGVSLFALAGSLILVAGATVILAAAMKIFATMSWEQIGKGLVGVAGSLTAVGLATNTINGPKLIASSAAMIPLAIAINILAVAVKIFATMSWEQLGKGLLGVAGALTAIGIGMSFMPPTLPLTAIGLIAVSAAMIILSGAVASFGHIRPDRLFLGIAGMAGALVTLGLAIDTIPPTVALQGAGLIVVAAGLTALSGAIAILGHMKVTTLVKGIIAMGGALVVLGFGLDAMAGTLPGSIALLAAAGAFAILAPTLGLLGHMSFGTIIKGLLAMAGILTVLAAGGLIAGPALVVLGVGILAVGLGLAAVGAAVYLFASGISLLSDKTVKAFTALVAAGGVFIAAFPTMVINFIKGIVNILGSVADLAPKIISALVSIVSQLLDAIIKLTPKIAQVIGVLISEIIGVLDKHAGPIIAAGFRLLVQLLSGIASNIGQVSSKVFLIITRFLGTLADNAPRLVASGARVLIRFLDGIINNLPRLIGTVTKLVVTFVETIGKNIPKVVNSAGNLIAKFLIAIGNQIPKIIAAGVHIITKFLEGIGNAIPRIINSAINVATKFVNAVARGLVRLVNVGFNAIINFLNGLATAIRKNSKAMFNAGWNVANAIIDGTMNGFSTLAGKLWDKAKEVFGKIPIIGKLVNLISSPSKVFMEIGMNIMRGLMIGLEDNAQPTYDAMTKTAGGVIDKARSEFGKVPDLLDGLMDTQPVITPILDLSGVKKDASQLSNLIQVPALVATTSLNQASAISDQKQALELATAVQVPPTTFSFEQNNYSPDPLSNIELYRQTNNQLSRIKSVVGVR